MTEPEAQPQGQPEHQQPAQLERLFSPRVTRWIVFGWMAVLLFAVGVLSVRATGEQSRTQAAVTDAITKEQERQAAEQTRQAAEQERQGRALCQSWKQTAESDVSPNASELARSIVRTAADDYRLVHCERFAGPLGEVDPEAYRPAPPSPPPVPGEN